MFFSDRIVSIKPKDRVLEIGPGGTPHERADVFLDIDPKFFKDEEEASYQRGTAPPLKTDKPIVYYDGHTFPFKDTEFDYVICSHVLEHVDDIDQFLSELFRVSKKGYIEFPTILYDYIYDIPVHHNFLLFNNSKNTLYWLKKSDTPFAEFKDVQKFFHESVFKGHDCLIQSLDASMMQGFEWYKPFEIKKASSIKQLVPSVKTIPEPKFKDPGAYSKILPPLIYKTLDDYSLEELKNELRARVRRRAKRYARRPSESEVNPTEKLYKDNIRKEIEYFVSINPKVREGIYLDDSISVEERLLEKMWAWFNEAANKAPSGWAKHWLQQHEAKEVGTHNLTNREAWLEMTLQKIPKGKKILDAGAGELQYKRFCSHLDYVSQDFAQYDGQGNTQGLQTQSWDNTKLDIVSDITDIPVKDKSFDAIMCIEVFEHIPRPLDALKEFSRILKRGGKLIITTPFSSLTHFAPYYFYNGYSRYFYERVLPEYGFSIDELNLNGNYFEYLGQEVRRFDAVAKQYARSGIKPAVLDDLAKQFVLQRLEKLSESDGGSSELLVQGIHVLATKK